MRTSLSILLTVLISLSIVYALPEKVQPKCTSSPLYIILEQYYEGHPFRDVNLARNESHWNINEYDVQFNSMDNYKLRSKKVGSGTFSKVFKAKYLPDGSRCVLKQLVTESVRAMKREIQIMDEIADIPNILPLRDIIRQNTTEGGIQAGFIFDCFKTIDYEDLFPTLSKSEVKYFIYETLRTLHLVHSRGIVHRGHQAVECPDEC